ncbi:MAG: acyl-CoA desaturase [Pseudomonadota bacterium]
MSTNSAEIMNEGVNGVSKRKMPLPTVGIPSLMKKQRRVAMVTIITPALATLLAIVLAFINGIGVTEALSFLIMYTLVNLGIEFGFHRNIAHNAFKAKKWLTYTFAVLGSMAAQGSITYWVATHRRHHLHSDTEHDPHSPHARNVGESEDNMPFLKGVLHSHIGWMFNDKMTNMTMFAKDLNKSEGFCRINDNYISIVMAGLLLPAVVAYLITGSYYAALMGVLWGGFVRMFVGHHSTWLNSSFSHLYGGKTFDAGDRSRNNYWCAIPTFGASFQNNHHAFPWSAYLGFRWYQVDIAGYFVSLCKSLKLVWNVRCPTEAQKNEKRVSAV